jgi:hypothetical protein
MMMTWASNGLKSATMQNTNSAQLYNTYSAATFEQSVSLLKPPSGRRWNIEAESLPWDASTYLVSSLYPQIDFTIAKSDLNDLTIYTESIGPINAYCPTNSYVISSGESAADLLVRSAEQRLSSLLDSHVRRTRALAAFKVTLWETFEAPATSPDAFCEAVSSDVESPLLLVRSELQQWLEVSLDDLAFMLDLSPTTLVNLTKPGRTVRPKTARKVVALHGLLRELQRALGSNAALTWSRTVGRRLLMDRRVLDFEQYISTHIFADDFSRKTPLAQTWDDSPSLTVKSIAPVGRPSRI